MSATTPPHVEDRDSDDLDDVVSHELSEAQMLLEKSVRRKASLEDIAVQVKEARARLEYLERQLECIDETDESDQE
jgi:hypothetical protein